ncbi:MAG: GntR family transcriptional regulator [Actinomycetota bacterium]|nr:GntR family transcriptional regulator [Actinomycetota bacterium]
MTTLDRSSPVRLKHEAVAAVLAREIRSGAVRRGARLPGEIALAKRFKVSRTTVRAALARLSEEGLIATRNGKGSFVCFAGQPVEARIGWAWALTAKGVATDVRIDRLALVRNVRLARTLGLASREFVVVERSWVLPSGAVACHEASHIPAIGGLRSIPQHGLSGGSLTATLREAGLVLSHGRQRIRGRAIDAREAALVGTPVGTWMLELIRTSYDASGAFVEHVVGLLDPAHFEVGIRFGDES